MSKRENEESIYRFNSCSQKVPSIYIYRYIYIDTYIVRYAFSVLTYSLGRSETFARVSIREEDCQYVQRRYSN